MANSPWRLNTKQKHSKQRENQIYPLSPLLFIVYIYFVSHWPLHHITSTTYLYLGCASCQFHCSWRTVLTPLALFLFTQRSEQERTPLFDPADSHPLFGPLTSSPFHPLLHSHPVMTNLPRPYLTLVYDVLLYFLPFYVLHAIYASKIFCSSLAAHHGRG